MDGLTQSESFLGQSKFYIVGGLTEHEIISRAIAEEGSIIFGSVLTLRRISRKLKYTKIQEVGKNHQTMFPLPFNSYDFCSKSLYSLLKMKY